MINLVLLWLSLLYLVQSLRPDSSFEIDCPNTQTYTVTNVRTYAIALINAQRNLEITLSYNKQNNENASKCRLSKDNQLCLFDNFVQEFSTSCTEEGSASLLIIEPTVASKIAKDEPLNQRALVPVLQQKQKGVIVFKSGTKIQKVGQVLDDIFISNCIRSVCYFQDQILIGVRQSPESQKCIIMLNDGFSGEWSFQSAQNNLDAHQIIESYLLPAEPQNFTIQPSFITHGVRLFIRTQNQTLLSNISLTIHAGYRLPSGNQQQLERIIQISAADLKGKIPIKVLFFFQQHPLNSFKLTSSENIHFVIEAVSHEEATFLSVKHQESENQEIESPVIEEDEHLFYAYEKFHPNTLQVVAHIRKSYHSYQTPLLRVIAKNGHIVNAAYHENGKDNGIDIVSNQIAPIQIVSDESFVEFNFLLEIEEPIKLQPISQQNMKGDKVIGIVQGVEDVGKISPAQPSLYNINYHENNILSLLLESSLEINEINIGQLVSDFLFENQIKRYFISRQQLTQIQDKKLYIQCDGCYVYATYSPKCTNIDCCEYSHVGLLDNRYQRLMIMVAASTHQEQTSLIHLLVTQGQQKIRLRDGKIYQAILKSEATYLFRAQADDQIQIICNSGAQSVLILANIDKPEFPTKKTFEHQSNQGFLRLPSIKKQTDIFIKLLPMNIASSSISYTLTVSSKLFPLLLIQGKPLHRRLKNGQSHSYLIQHPCNPNQSIFLRISTKQNGITVNKLSLKMKIKQQVISNVQEKAEIIEEFNGSITTEITSFFSRYTKSKVCQLEITLGGSSSSSIMSTIMFFTEKQSYQIFPGKFNVDYLLADTPLHLFCVVEPSKPVTVYSYSMSQKFIMKVSIKRIGQIKQLRDEKKHLRNFPMISQEDEKWESFSHHEYLSATFGNDQQQQLLVVLITLGKLNENSDNFDKKPIQFVCTQGRTRMELDSKLFYHLDPQQTHIFEYQINPEHLMQVTKNNYQWSNDSQIILQTSPFVGKFNSSIRLFMNSKELGNLSGAIKTRNNYHQDPSFLVVTFREIAKLLQENQLGLAQLQHKLTIQFKILCGNSLEQTDKGCELMSSIQSSQSDVRELLPGWPQVFHISKHKSMIFIFNNAIDDRMFKFKINRKMGFPNYQICSSKTSYTINSRSQNGCLEKLKRRQQQNEGLFSDNIYKVDENLVLGRSHQLVINQFSSDYCTDCTYYLALYSGYDVVEGSLFVMSAKEPTVLESSTSITTIVYRNQPDYYSVASTSLVAVLYQIDGKVNIEVRGNEQDFYGYEWEEREDHSGGHSESIITIEMKNRQDDKNGFEIRLRPTGNSPSALYTLVVIDRQEQQINLKDGVPYEMSYADSSSALSSIIKYKYSCQNQGTIMVSTKKFDQLYLQAICLDSNQTIQIPKPLNIANRIDIGINPYICSNYQITIQALNPSISYTILASADDIVTLPLNKELPGMLKYQSKLFQIYQVQVREQTQLHCTMKFCQGGNGQVMIASGKKQLQKQIYEQQLDINQQTNFQSFTYRARPGVFYIKVQFKDRGGVLEYTLHVESHTGLSEHKSLSVYGNKTLIDYKLSKVNSKYSEFEIQFYPLVVSLQEFQISYYVIQSNQLDLLHRTQNCNGQYFAETVSHHQEISAKKIDLSNQLLQQISLIPRKITFKYRTTSPYNFITIVPLIYHRSTRAYYHLYVPKYTPVQLKNGQAFSSINFFLGDVAMRVQQYIDIHDSEKTVFLIGLIIIVTCCLLITAGGICLGRKYFTKVRTVYVMRDVNQEQDRLGDESSSQLEIN